MTSELELIVRINGNHPAFGRLGRSATREPKVCTSVSLFVFKDRRRAHHTLLDIGPGVCEAIQRDDAFPPAFPLDRVILSHAHGDHFLGLDALCGDYEWWARSRGKEEIRVSLLATPSVYEETVGMCFPFRAKILDHTPVEAGRSYTLWEEDEARLEVTQLEVAHFHRSTISIFTFHHRGEEARVVCLFDFGDFHEAGREPEEAFARADDSRFAGADLLIAESTFWADPATTIGKRSDHICFERLAKYLLQWKPKQARIVHYAGNDDIWGGGGPDRYWERVRNEERIHPSEGPTSEWELTHAIREHLARRGYPDPSSACVGSQGETMVVHPRAASARSPA